MPFRATAFLCPARRLALHGVSGERRTLRFVTTTKCPTTARSMEGQCRWKSARRSASEGARNLRRISCSPFSDIGLFAERLGRRAILSWKPDPSMIARDLQSGELEPYLRNSLRKAEGSQIEIVLKDTHTCGRQADRFTRWMETARRIADEEWRR